MGRITAVWVEDDEGVGEGRGGEIGARLQAGSEVSLWLDGAEVDDVEGEDNVGVRYDEAADEAESSESNTGGMGAWL